MSYTPIPKELFHVHTYRCLHAGEEREVEYVEKAIEVGAKRIVFTDHAPFPGDTFRYRMKYEELPGYISTIADLKEKYKNRIEILCGLEIEYLPGFRGYYEELKAMEGIELLSLGQHFCEWADGEYSFCKKADDDLTEALSAAIVQGIESGLFDVVAHPDRHFRYSKKMGDREKISGQKIIEAVLKQPEGKRPYLEKNFASIREDMFFSEFWDMVPTELSITRGIDAHSVAELEAGWKYWEKS